MRNSGQEGGRYGIQKNSTYPDAGYPYRLDSSGKFVENATKLTCLEITCYRLKYSTVLWLTEHLSTTLPSTPGSSEWFLSLRFLHQNSVYASPSPIRATCPAHLILLEWSASLCLIFVELLLSETRLVQGVPHKLKLVQGAPHKLKCNRQNWGIF
jgi:hypothetical protein